MATCICASLILSGCSFKRPRLPRVHKLTVQQGNVINQKMIDKLKPGMNRSQVAFIMGEPVVRNPFDDNRWDYVYTIELPGVYSTTQMVSLYFVDEQLAYFTGDLVPSRVTEKAAEAEASETEASDAEPAESGETETSETAAAKTANGESLES
jgi:outer membrane protein assembly factor BamE